MQFEGSILLGTSNQSAKDRRITIVAMQFPSGFYIPSPTSFRSFLQAQSQLLIDLYRYQGHIKVFSSQGKLGIFMQPNEIESSSGILY